MLSASCLSPARHPRRAAAHRECSLRYTARNGAEAAADLHAASPCVPVVMPYSPSVANQQTAAPCIALRSARGKEEACIVPSYSSGRVLFDTRSRLFADRSRALPEQEAGET